MAFKDEHGCYTEVELYENGKKWVRRAHQVQVQDPKGYVWELRDKQKPHRVVLCTGQRRDGKSLVQILLRPNDRPPFLPPNTLSLFDIRTAFGVVIGLSIVGTINFVLDLAAQAF